MTKKIVLIILTTSVLDSCTTQIPKPVQPVIVNSWLPLTVPLRSPLVTSKLVPLPPKTKNINWLTSLTPIVKRMLQIDGINSGSLLLVNTFKNDTNGNVQTDKATSTLIHIIMDSGGMFQVVDDDKLYAARQILGLSANDSFESRNKAVGLARYLNAQYMLYSTVIGDVKAPILNLQLMLVKSGEIIWSGNGIAED